MRFPYQMTGAILAGIFALLNPLSGKAHAAAGARKAEKGLTREEAERRAQRVADVHYRLFVNLDSRGDSFSGEATASFQLKDATAPLTLDFEGGQIKSVKINGKTPKVAYNSHFLTLPASALKNGQNDVIISYTHPYSTTGAGLYRFKDPEDGEVYIYTDFEPYDANRFFPCFDQPDLKATYTFSAEAPEKWQVVSSARETKVAPVAKGGRKLWTFPETAKFSTYLFSLVAGPYHVWEEKADQIPLRLFARASMAKYVDAAGWFKITQQGLKFYNEYFGVAYPFGKYDQLIVPDFNAGAMENVAAVTFSERFVPRGVATASEREDRASVILHEMAHMWFGDLVTMRWWNDLWLNESFATFMSALASAEATEFKNAWVSFHSGEKLWAYEEDQRVTTHPIEGLVPDTEQAFANFDGITYGKGASVLKLAQFQLTPEKFREGVRRYFKKHAFQNAELKDFMAALSEASGQDMDAWAKEWLRTSGVNTVGASYDCRDEKIARFELEQTSPNGVLRTHRTQVGLFHSDENGGITFDKSVAVVYTGAKTPVAELVGQPCPAFVLPNFGDFDYAKVRLDAQSLATGKASLSRFDDPLQRMMIWGALWEMVRDGDMAVTEYADTVLAHVASESELKVAQRATGTVASRRRSGPSVMYYLPRSGKDGDELRRSYAQKLEALFLETLSHAPEGSDLQKMWFDASVRVVNSPQGGEKLAAMINGQGVPQGLVIDQDRRWQALVQLNALDVKGADALRVAELKQDKSAYGKQMALEAEAAQPRLEVKQRFFKETLLNPNKRPLAELKAVMRGMFPGDQADLRQRFGKEFFAEVPKLVKTKDAEFMRPFVETLVPAVCEDASVNALASFISGHQDLPPVTLKELRIAREEDGRCIKIRQTALKSHAS